MMDGTTPYQVTINNWDKHQQGRKDVTNPTWFRMNVGMWRGQSLFGLTAEQKWVWVGLLSFAAEKNCERIEIIPDWFCRECGVSLKTLENSLVILARNGCVTWTARGRDVDVTSTTRGRDATDRQTNKQTDTTDTTVGIDPVSLFRNLWESNLSELNACAVKQWTEKRKAAIRARWGDSKDPAIFDTVFHKAKESPFIRGEVVPRDGFRQFKLDVDWMLNPNNWVKILEGKYSYDSAEIKPITHWVDAEGNPVSYGH